MFVYTVKDIVGIAMLGIFLVCGLLIAGSMAVNSAKRRWAKWRSKRKED